MHAPFSISSHKSSEFATPYSDELYHIFLFNGRGQLAIDLVPYDFSGETVLFTSPYQHIEIRAQADFEIEVLNFHGDYYCIEYHKKEVACNGVLFNNIYLFPHFSLAAQQYEELLEIFQKIRKTSHGQAFSDAVQRSYLQLILALSSQTKSALLAERKLVSEEFAELKTFQTLVEEHFRSQRSPAFYAEQMHISPNTLSKKIKQEYNKNPSQIIQERVILEAKKLIHLTRKSIKEISDELNFADEHYFSRYFKKHCGVSPLTFRKEVGISIVADL